MRISADDNRPLAQLFFLSHHFSLLGFLLRPWNLRTGEALIRGN